MFSKEYTLMKFNVLRTALDPEIGKRLDDSYVYAWDVDVYPAFHDGTPWHLPFEEDFLVSKEMMTELIARLDNAWNLGQGTAPTFYELERIYNVGGAGEAAWSRSKLLRAMRYIAIYGHSFDPKFFSDVTRDAGAPTEANNFADPFNRHESIYLM